jgi:hypothetical protein
MSYDGTNTEDLYSMITPFTDTTLAHIAEFASR